MTRHEDPQVVVPGAAPGTTARGPMPAAAPLLRTLLLAVTLVALAGATYLWRVADLIVPTSGVLPWSVVALIFGLAEVLVFHIEIRREAISFSLSEIPMTLALFFASPKSLIVGRLVGEALLLVLHERQQFRKVVLNLAMFFAECVLALTVFHAIPGTHDPNHPVAWGAAFLAVAAADSIGLVVLTLVMRWHGAPVEPTRVFATNAVTFVTNTSLAVLISVLVHTNGSAAGLLLVVSAIVVVAYRGYSALSRRYSSLELLYEFTRLVSGWKRPELVLASMLQETRRMLRAEAAAIILVGESEPISLWLGADDEVAQRRSLPVERLRSLVADGRAVVIDRKERDPSRRALLAELGVSDCIVAPLVEAAEQIGVLVVAERETAVSTFEPEDGRIFETLANHAGVALENGRLIDRLHEQAQQREYEALHDPLTCLPNRAHFLQRLTATISVARSDARPLGVALLDLDHFKEVNDTLGHHHGDLLLREVSNRLRTALPATVLLARLGGDEFGLLTDTDASIAGLLELGHQIQRCFTQPFWVEGLGLDVGVSIGFARFPEHGVDPTTLLQRADVAMYDAKSSSTDRIEIYEPARDVNSPRRLALATDLRTAIERCDLVLHYQPKARLRDGLVHSVEGLVRWRHPVYGNVPPDDFVPLAERTGLIHPFTDFILEYGIRDLEQWTRDGLDLGLSLNLSARNLLDQTLPERVGELLRDADVDAAKLTFEVTETSVMSDPAKSLEVLEALASLGVRLSIDDFGTGHSSLAYLQRLPVHEVKVDKSFVLPITGDRGARAIVQSIIQLAHNLELTVVAEGVEDEPTWMELQHLKCDDAQGYHLCRPIDRDALMQWLRSPVGAR